MVCATARVHVRARVRKSVLRMGIKVSQEGFWLRKYKLAGNARQGELKKSFAGHGPAPQRYPCYWWGGAMRC